MAVCFLRFYNTAIFPDLWHYGTINITMFGRENCILEVLTIFAPTLGD